MRTFLAALVMGGAAVAPAWADPDVHTVTLPDGTTLTTISDTNSQLWGPSSNQRVLVQCRPECAVVESEVNSFNFLQGIWNAVGEAARRPTRINNTTATNVANGSSSESGASAYQHQRAEGGEADVGVRVSNENDLRGYASAEAGAFQVQGQAQGQLQGQLQGQGQEQVANGGQGGSGGNGGAGGNGNNAQCGNGQQNGNGNGQGCDDD